jgi:dolichyl-phosphate-mannose-protein mannosyltransferase
MHFLPWQHTIHAVTQTVIAPATAVSRPDAGLMAMVKRRLTPPETGINPYGWMIAFAIALLAFVIRVVNIAHPGEMIFDEVYYADDGNDMLHHGVEWDAKNNTAGYVVHPPLGKWIIALGIKAFGFSSLGWRMSAVIFGTISVFMMVRIAYRLFGSLVLASAAGLLLAFDGMHFVLSRTALLDIFLMFFVLATFGALLLDRDQQRRRWADFIAGGADPAGKGRASRPAFMVPWFRLLAAFMLGCAVSVKWSALAFLPAAIILVIWWGIGLRRTAGVRRPVMDTFLDEIGWLLACFAIILVVYLGSWTGWFISDDGFYRNHSTNALSSLIFYHEQALAFHGGLESGHPYESDVRSWLLLARPVAFHFTKNVSCGGPDCSEEILLVGNPILWWSFIPMLVASLWFGIARRDWRIGAVLVFAGFALIPWFFFLDRTSFFFYAAPALPFMILAVVYVLGSVMTPPPGKPRDENRLLYGTVFAGFFVLMVGLTFVYFYPIYVGEPMTTADWNQRMWLGNRWV